LPTQLDEEFDIPTQIPQRVVLEPELGLGLALAQERVPELGRELGLVLGQHRQQPS